MYLLAVGEDQAFARGNGPDEGNVMLFTATGSTRLAGSKGFGVGKAKAPRMVIGRGSWCGIGVERSES